MNEAASLPEPRLAGGVAAAARPAHWRIWVAIVGAVSGIALLGCFMLWQKVLGIQEQLARQSAEATARATEARGLAREAQETVRGTSARLAMAETRVNEVALQRAQLEELIVSLSRSRDDTLLVDIESGLRLALEQAQITGSVEPLLVSLKSAEQRIVRAPSQPRLVALQRAMATDADRIRSNVNADSTVALQKLDDLMRGVDELPAANAVVARGMADADLNLSVPDDAAWWVRAVFVVRQEIRSLVRIGRIERPENALLAPDQVFFLRENMKLKLLSARLALLSRRIEAARNDISSVTASLNRYFDPASRRTQAAATLLQQLQSQVRAIDPPNIDDTLAALALASASGPAAVGR